MFLRFVNLCTFFRYEAPAEAFGLLSTSLTVFLLIFVPKAVQLANPVQDFGPSSHLGSHSALQTPSFLHLQPQAILPNNGQGTMIKQSHVNAGNLFDFIYPACVVPLPVEMTKGCHATIFLDYDCTIMDIGCDLY